MIHGWSCRHLVVAERSKDVLLTRHAMGGGPSRPEDTSTQWVLSVEVIVVIKICIVI